MVNDLYDFMHSNYNQLLKFVEELSELPEFEKLKQKMWEENEAKAHVEAEKAFKKKRTDISIFLSTYRSLNFEFF